MNRPNVSLFQCSALLMASDQSTRACFMLYKFNGPQYGIIYIRHNNMVEFS